MSLISSQYSSKPGIEERVTFIVSFICNDLLSAPQCSGAPVQQALHHVEVKNRYAAVVMYRPALGKRVVYEY